MTAAGADAVGRRSSSGTGHLEFTRPGRGTGRAARQPALGSGRPAPDAEGLAVVQGKAETLLADRAAGAAGFGLSDRLGVALVGEPLIRLVRARLTGPGRVENLHESQGRAGRPDWTRRLGRHGMTDLL